MTMTVERKLSDKLAKLLDTLELDMEWIPFAFANHHGTAMQRRMFDLCIAFIRHWSNRYASGDILPDQILYPVCQQCYNMLKPLDDADQAEYNSPRARRLRRIAELEAQPYGRHADLTTS